MRQGKVKGLSNAFVPPSATRPQPPALPPLPSPEAAKGVRRSKSDEAEGRPIYRAANGVSCVSVTTVIGKAADPEPLISWAHRTGWERITLRAAREPARIGTAVHDVVQAVCEERCPVAVDEWLTVLHSNPAFDRYNDLDDGSRAEAWNALKAFGGWWPSARQRYRVVGTEVRLVHDGLQVGGSADVLLEDLASGEPVGLVGDWKTSRATYAEMIAQVAAYGLLLHEGRINDASPCPFIGRDIRHGLIVRLPKKGAAVAEVLELGPAEMAEGLRQFYGALQVYNSRDRLTTVLKEHAKAVRAAAQAAEKE